ncbi:hypothetical protein GCM10007967_13610 [Xylanimonas ulmi]
MAHLRWPPAPSRVLAPYQYPSIRLTPATIKGAYGVAMRWAKPTLDPDLRQSLVLRYRCGASECPHLRSATEESRRRRASVTALAPLDELVDLSRRVRVRVRGGRSVARRNRLLGGLDEAAGDQGCQWIRRFGPSDKGPPVVDRDGAFLVCQRQSLRRES